MCEDILTDWFIKSMAFVGLVWFVWLSLVFSLAAKERKINRQFRELRDKGEI